MAQIFIINNDSTLLNCLYELFPGQSRTGVQAYLKDRRVIVTKKNISAFDYPVKKGDTIEILSKGASIGREMKLEAKDILARNGVRIIYEDEHLIVIDKNAGLPSIAPKSKSDRRVKSAYSLLTDYMHTEKRANIKSGEGDYKASSRVFVVHRLDRDTSGLLLFAKDEYTKQLMQSKWNEMVLERKYIAVLEGRPDKDSGRIESWLSENEKSLKVSSSPVPVEGGQHAVSYFKVLEARKRCCVVEFELETGRKNQIRVHASKVLGKPIIGDKKYDAVSGFKGRIALHAKTLVFRNPYGGMTMSFESPVPVEFDYLK